MIVFDSKSVVSNSSFECVCTHKGPAYEHRTYHFFTNHGFHSQAPIQSMYPSLSRQLPPADIFVLRSIPVHGLCTTGFQRIAPRHRNLSAGNGTKTIPMQAFVAGLPRALWPTPTKNAHGKYMPTSRRYSSPRHGHYTATTVSVSTSKMPHTHSTRQQSTCA